jgi:exopolyphosphatase/guanosine-5'-triphosphate,3'-diphosphate pyrophosphatase
MRAAAIDIGTNTTLALLAEDGGDDLRVLKDQQTPNRMGESLRNSSEISAQTIALNIDLLNEIIRDFRREGAQEFALCGTSALRIARNREEFISSVRDILDLRVEVLSGTDEAKLTFAGAVSGRDLMPHEKTGVIDLGGGSTEVIEGQGESPRQSCSLDTGAVYLTNQYFADSIPTADEIERLRIETRDKLLQLFVSLHRENLPWILVGGTAVTLAMLKAGLKRYDAAKISGTKLTNTDLTLLSRSFQGKHPDELQALPGMPLSRGKIIFAGTLLMIELYNALNIKEAMVTERGLRHGLWMSRFHKRGSV